MDEWAAFLKARLDEDKAAANEVHRPRDCGSVDRDGEFDPDPIWCGCDYPARALREVEAGRRILARHSPAEGIAVPGPACIWCSDDTDTVSLNMPWPCPDVLDLLSRWDGHPDYPGRQNTSALKSSRPSVGLSRVKPLPYLLAS